MVKNVANLFAKIELPNRFKIDIQDFNFLCSVTGQENVQMSMQNV